MFLASFSIHRWSTRSPLCDKCHIGMKLGSRVWNLFHFHLLWNERRGNSRCQLFSIRLFCQTTLLLEPTPTSMISPWAPVTKPGLQGPKRHLQELHLWHATMTNDSNYGRQALLRDVGKHRQPARQKPQIALTTMTVSPISPWASAAPKSFMPMPILSVPSCCCL